MFLTGLKFSVKLLFFSTENIMTSLKFEIISFIYQISNGTEKWNDEDEGYTDENYFFCENLQSPLKS